MGVRQLPPSTNFNPEQALSSALQEKLTDVIVLGYYEDGSLFIRSSRLTVAEANFMIDKAKAYTLAGGNV